MGTRAAWQVRNRWATRGPAGLAVLLSAALVGLLFYAVGAGAYPLSLTELLSALSAGPDPQAAIGGALLWQVRLPRVAAALLAGAALSIAGAGMQTVMRNPLAAPDLLGVSAGAALGAVVGILLGWSPVAVQSAAFLGGAAAVLLVWQLAHRLPGSNRILTLILCGLAIGSLLSAGVALAKVLADPTGTLPVITFWLLGSFAGVTPVDAVALLFTTGLSALVLAALGWRIDLLSLSDDEAHASGVRARRLRALVVLACTLAASGAVAVAGIIGWIGLIVPHAIRLLIGGGFARGLLPTGLAGALLMLLVDTLTRSVPGGELPPGVLMALIGAPTLFGLMALRVLR